MRARSARLSKIQNACGPTSGLVRLCAQAAEEATRPTPSPPRPHRAADALVTWASHVDVYRVVIGLGLVLAPLGLLFAILGARNLHRRTWPGRLYLPLGVGVVVALPPFWDYGTSGDCLAQ